MSDIYEAINAFDFDGKLKGVTEFGSGHINGTFLAEYENNKYVVQKINKNVFKNPDGLMRNIFLVTSFLKKEVKKNGGDTQREVLNFIKTKDSKDYYTSSDGECYRAYAFVKNSVSYDVADTPELFRKSGVAFGRFQKMLENFDASSLFETIPHFHDTPWRYHTEFDPAAAKDVYNRAKNCEDEISFVKECEKNIYRISDALSLGKIPLRVTHNDTKLNNILFDKNTGESLAVIDLDTVMPGSALYDFGDSIRFGASTAAEDEKDLSKVKLNLDYFKAYSEGYLSEAGDSLTETEKELLPYSAWLITFECAMRFLTDYLNGDVYFKIDYPEHNLVRARNQFTLAKDISTKLDAMKEIIKEIKY